MDAEFALRDLNRVRDVSSADWVVAGVRNFKHDVGSLVPLGFDAYARVFHPAGRTGASDAEVPVAWAQVAVANGRVVHPAMEWIAITGDWKYLNGDVQPGIWDVPPSTGSLPRRPAASLARVLAAYTATPRACWFAIWDGYGGAPYAGNDVPRVHMPSRPMVLFAGPLSGATTSFDEPGDQRAHLWWPDDRRWCVATDVDLMTTYVAGSADCIAAVLTDPELEALRVTADQSVTWQADTVNPTPAPPPDPVGRRPTARERRLRRGGGGRQTLVASALDEENPS